MHSFPTPCRKIINTKFLTVYMVLIQWKLLLWSAFNAGTYCYLQFSVLMKKFPIIILSRVHVYVTKNSSTQSVAVAGAAVYLETLKIKPKNHRSAPRLLKQKQSKNLRKEKINKKVTQPTKQSTNFARYMTTKRNRRLDALLHWCNCSRDAFSTWPWHSSAPLLYCTNGHMFSFQLNYTYTHDSTTLRRQRPF